MKPLRLAVEEQERHVGERAGTEAAADGEVHDIAQPPALPLEVKGLRGDGREAVLGAPAAAAARAHEEMAAGARHVDGPPVGADHDIAAPLVGHGAGGATSATPIRASRVTRGTRSASPSRSVPAGRCGSTM